MGGLEDKRAREHGAAKAAFFKFQSCFEMKWDLTFGFKLDSPPRPKGCNMYVGI